MPLEVILVRISALAKGIDFAASTSRIRVATNAEQKC
jgi:hypothetical protein